ncbi:uncharacterized protein LOC127121993 [Lathyrus oleraceus]|uniref:uncharacterized protein LOC127121993 n=1 Tax=Pisum sativum TaxID=3888 RepID=UPI0021D30560|nr:uncharacterized protein LOC127121993 [Pisum sativum]
MAIKDCEIPGPDEGPEPGSRWKLAFDDASNYTGHGIEAVIVYLNGGFTPFTTRLCFGCTNNMEEYEACIIDIKVVIDLHIKNLEVYIDFDLVICQIKGEWETWDSKLIPYRTYVRGLIKYFDDITFHHIPREENQVAGALATLASMYQVRFCNEASLLVVERKTEPTYF